ncbi:twin-arginine translocation pathway signal [Mycobacterium intermedium]|uniref:twin-arginine translocation pathway signal n=1 Tax=Mycobacterium intermedium TaxID=28445 RepID=UPI00111C60CD|nr:twin-arginine translocation pathway signal [Mycobacterium intermedium]
MAAWQPILVTALVIGSLVLAGGTYFFRYEPDSQVGDAAVQQAIRAATEGTVAMLSYSAESLDQDFARAKSHLTGDLLAYYTKFTEETVAPTAKEKRIWASAKVIRAAVAEMRRDSAVVLMFVNQSTEVKEQPQPTVTESNVLVTMAKIDGSWLIAKFDPL